MSQNCKEKFIMGSLKDALMKAGLKPSKSENERPKPKRNKVIKKVHTHQQERNFCEVCNRTLPDVEMYKHRNPVVNASWICLQCADKNMISDDFRETNQSEYSRKGIFRREFGRTKRFSVTGSNAPKEANRNANGNANGNARGNSSKSANNNNPRNEKKRYR